MSSKITIIRHAPTEYNSQNIFIGTLDIPVVSFNDKIVKELQRLLLCEKYTAIYSSPLQRSIQTAKKIFGDEYNIILDKRLIERDLGIWQGHNKEDIKKNNLNAFHGDNMDFYYTPEKGEHFESVILRAVSFIYECCNSPVNILTFTHNGVFRVLKSLLTGIPLSSAFSIKEPFLEPQSFIVEDRLFTTILKNPFYTVEKQLIKK